MAIFLLTSSLGGAEQLLYKIGLNLNIKRVFVFGKKQNDNWEDAGFEVVYFNNSFINMVKCVRKHRFNYVFSSHLMMNALLGFLRFIGILKTNKLISRESTSVFLRFSGFKLFKYNLAYRVGYRSMDLLITQSDSMKSILLDNAPYLEKRVKVKTIPNLFTYPVIVNEKSPYNFQYIVSAGRLIPEKGFDILIDSFESLHTENPTLKLVILGEGEKRTELEKQIINLNLNESVLLPGFVDDVYQYFKHAEMCVVSSHIEGFPNVLLQMMSQNNKVVSTLCAGGIEELKGVNTCHINNVDGLYRAMSETLKKDTTDNRELFDVELKSRSIDNFVNKIEEYINE